MPEDNLIAFEMDGKTRQYMLYIPESLKANAPLVFVTVSYTHLTLQTKRIV